nr:hypothetical protein [Tanacetum cinerariifolium]
VEQMTSLTSMCELACQIVQKKLEEKQLKEEQAAKAQSWKLPVCYDDDDDEEKIVSDNSNADIESFTPSPIPNEDSGSHMEEINLPFTQDDPMPPGIKDDDYESGRDISILEELLDNYSLSLPANESYHFDIPLP